MEAQELANRVGNLNVWKRGSERAPHKSLLLLYALGRLQKGEDAVIPFSDVNRDLTSLLEEFGPTRRSYHPEYPFWRLQKDGLWELQETEGLETRKGNTDPYHEAALFFARSPSSSKRQAFFLFAERLCSPSSCRQEQHRIESRDDQITDRACILSRFRP